jgi:hypothetical protein
LGAFAGAFIGTLPAAGLAGGNAKGGAFLVETILSYSRKRKTPPKRGL